MLQSYGVVTICAPPGTGKTSLCQLVTSIARASSVFQQVYYFSCDAVSNNASFESQFHNMCGIAFYEAAQQASASNRTVIVIDEAQNTFDVVSSLWGWAKLVKSCPTNPQSLMILTASSHGCQTLASAGHIAPAIEFRASSSIVVR